MTILMLCSSADTVKPVHHCAEILLTEVVPAFEKIPTLIGTEGIVAGKAHVFSPMRQLDG